MFNESQIRLFKIVLGCLAVFCFFFYSGLQREPIELSLEQVKIPFLELSTAVTQEDSIEDDFKPMVIDSNEIKALGLDSLESGLISDSIQVDSSLATTTTTTTAKPIQLHIDNTPVSIDPNDTTDERILLVGDSQVECVRNAVYNYTLHNNHKLVASVTWYGSVTLDWGYSDTLSYYIKKYQPTTVIYVIGLNEIFVKPGEDRKEQFRNVLNTIEAHNLKYCVLGPAAWEKDFGIVNAMAEIAGIHFFDASKMTLARASDGRHPSLAGGYTWFEAAAEYMTEFLDINFSNKITGKKYFEKDSPLFVIKNKRFKKPAKTAIAAKTDSNKTLVAQPTITTKSDTPSFKKASIETNIQNSASTNNHSESSLNSLQTDKN